MPRMNGLKLVENLRNRETRRLFCHFRNRKYGGYRQSQRPVSMFRQPVKISTACGKPYSLAYTPICLTRGLLEEERLFRDWDAMVSNQPLRIRGELQPPAGQQVISHCRILPAARLPPISPTGAGYCAAI